MTGSHDTLQQRRKAFNTFAATVLPAEALKRDDLSFSDLARHIEDEAARKQFCKLAMKMLDANIAHYRTDATRKRPLRLNLTLVVASTLVIAGLVQHFEGTAAALIAAGLWYWVSATTVANRTRHVKEDARIHNADAAEWAKTIKDWEAERDELSKVEALGA